MNYNLPDSHFKNVPLSTNNKFSVYALNDQGFENYLNSDSHNHHFLNKIDPKILKEFMEEEEAKKNQINKVNQPQQNTSPVVQNNQHPHSIKETKAEPKQQETNMSHQNMINQSSKEMQEPQSQSQSQQAKSKSNTNRQQQQRQPPVRSQEVRKVIQQTQRKSPVIAQINQSNKLRK